MDDTWGWWWRYYLFAVSECGDVLRSECEMQMRYASNRCKSRWYVCGVMVVVREREERTERRSVYVGSATTLACVVWVAPHPPYPLIQPPAPAPSIPSTHGRRRKAGLHEGVIAQPPSAGATGIRSLNVHHECGARVVCVDAVKSVRALTTLLAADSYSARRLIGWQDKCYS